MPRELRKRRKRQSGRTRKGNRYLRRLLIQNAWAVSRTKDCFLTALFYRIASRRGLKRAAMAVGHRVLTIAYFIIRDGTEYREAGSDYYDRRNPDRTASRRTQRLERIGYQVALTKVDGPGLLSVPHSKIPKYGTTRWSLSQLQRTIPRSPKGPPATLDICPKCARWGIACIHVRTAKSNPSPDIKPIDSSG